MKIKLFILSLLLLFTAVNLYCQVDSTAYSESSQYESPSAYVGPDLDSLNDALLVACFDEDLNAVLSLLNNGANVNAKDYWTDLPALGYAIDKGNFDIVKVLVVNGAYIVKSGSYSPLHHALEANNDTIVEYLISKGADINEKDESGTTPLMKAASYGYYIMCDMLLYYGADPNQKDDNNATALMAAVYNFFPDIAELLIQKGADPALRDTYGRNAIHYAAETGDTISLQVLANAGVDLNQQTNNGLTALAMATKYNRLQAVEFLVNHNVNVNADLELSSIRKSTALSIAYSNGNKTIKKLLREHGASPLIMPEFTQKKIGYNVNWNFTDIMFDLHYGIIDTRYKLGVTLGYDFRLGKKRVLHEIEENQYYQFWEWRNYFYSELSKSFTVASFKNKQTVDLALDIAGVYSFGDYRATKTKPVRGLIAAPGAKVSYGNRDFMLTLGYKYMDFGVYRTSPHRLLMGISVIINSYNKDFDHQKNEWIDWRSNLTIE